MVPRRYRLLCCAVPAAALNLLVVIAIEPGSGIAEYVTLGLFFGTFFGHATLSAAWAAVGPGPIGWRIPGALTWIVLLPIAVAVNVWLNGGPSDGALIVGIPVFGQWLLVQLLLWPLAIGFGLRLRHVDDWGRRATREPDNSDCAI